MAHSIRFATYSFARRAYSSLPWGYRLAEMIVRIGSDTAADFGRTAYALFAYCGVTGLPDIKGQPGESAVPKKPGESAKSYLPRFLRAAPTTYGSAFGRKLYLILLRKHMTETVAEDVLQEMAASLFTSTTAITALEGRTLREAESYMLRSVNLRGIDVERKNRTFDRRRPDRKTEIVNVDEGTNEEGAPSGVVLSDPKAWSALEDMLPETEMRAILEKVREAVPAKWKDDVAAYFDLALDGVPDTVINKNRLLPMMRQDTLAEKLTVDQLMALTTEERDRLFRDKAGNPVKNPAGNDTNLYQRLKSPIRKVLKEHFDVK